MKQKEIFLCGIYIDSLEMSIILILLQQISHFEIFGVLILDSW